MSRERLDDDLMMLRDMRERLNKMLATVKADPELERGELVHVTGELIKSLEAEIRALERAIGEIDERKGKVERSE